MGRNKPRRRRRAAGGLRESADGMSEPLPLGVDPAKLVGHTKLIEKLRKDNEALRHELQLNASHEKMLNNTRLTSKLSNMHEKIDLYTRKIQEQRLKIEDKEKKILALREKKIVQQQTKGGVEASKINNEIMAKQIKILEGRLEGALLKYNANIVRNKELRGQIDHIRRDRAAFDRIYKGIEDEIFAFNRDAAKTGKQQKLAEKQLQEARESLKKLHKKSEEQFKQFEGDWRGQHKNLEEQRKEHTLEASQDAQAAAPADQAGEGMENKPVSTKGHVGSLSIEQEKALRRKVIKQKFQIAQKKISINSKKKSLTNYQEMFAQLYEVTGISDANELARQFLESEERIYSIFRHINSLEQNVEDLSRDVTEHRSEIAKYTAPSVAQEKYQKNCLLEQLDTKLERTRRRTVQFDVQYQHTGSLLDAIKAHIQHLFQTIGCHVPNSTGDMGAELSVMQSLGMVEQRTRELAKQAGVTFATKRMAKEERDLRRVQKQRKKGINKKLNNDAIFGEEYSSDSDNDNGLQPLDTTRAMKQVARHFSKENSPSKYSRGNEKAAKGRKGRADGKGSPKQGRGARRGQPRTRITE